MIWVIYSFSFFKVEYIKSCTTLLILFVVKRDDYIFFKFHTKYYIKNREKFIKCKCAV